MAVVRNIQLKLDVPEDAHSVLDATFEQFRHTAQHVADTGWDDDPTEIEDRKDTLHDQTYVDVREQTSLQASLVQSARSLAADALGAGRVLGLDAIIERYQVGGQALIERYPVLDYVLG
jgi:hypothetical protein